MCGIVGVVGDADGHAPRFGRALSSIAHRGPDGEGIERRPHVLFGHRRLAIIGLGPAGHQPMIDRDTGAMITFNGEIYNYIEIRAELAAAGVPCEGETDTEVLLRAFLHWREAMFSRLNGMWSFAIWEPARGTVTLARDRFGVKPLYWHVGDGSLIFASEPKALIALDPGLAEPSPRAVFDLVVNSRSFAGEATFYRRIHSLPPAHWAVFRPGEPTLTARRYWDFPPAEGEPVGEAAAADEFAALFDDAVALRLRSDVPVGLTLSGGLDSSAVLAAAQKRRTAPMRCFTSVYSDSDRGEEAWAQIAAAAWGADLEAVEASATSWLPTLEQIVDHMDGPGFSPAVFPLWAIMRHARESGVPVLLEGQGADELLAGYAQYAGIELGARLGATLRERHGGGALRDFYTTAAAAFGRRMLLQWMVRHQFPRLDRALGPRRARRRLFIDRSLGETARVDHVSTLPPLLAALHADHSEQILPPLLQYGDAISMAHGIETRLPFMDYRLVEWVFRRRPQLIVGGRTKVPVRHYLGANRLAAIANRPDKKGYPTLIARWLSGGVGQAFLGDLLASPNAELFSLIDRAAFARLVAEARSGDDKVAFHLYKLLVTQIWLRNTRERGSAAAAPPIARIAA